jgi:hypothetical protein
LEKPKLLLWAYLIAKKPVFEVDPAKFSIMAWNLSYKEKIKKLDSITISAREAYAISERLIITDPRTLIEISEILQNIVPPRENIPNDSTFNV